MSGITNADVGRRSGFWSTTIVASAMLFALGFITEPDLRSTIFVWIRFATERMISHCGLQSVDGEKRFAGFLGNGETDVRTETPQPIKLPNLKQMHCTGVL